MTAVNSNNLGLSFYNIGKFYAFTLISILFFCNVFTSTAQNLVLNPSFEDTISTNYTIHYPICKNWFNPNVMTTDYFSPFCQELLWGNGYCTPITSLGFQQPKDSSAYIGLVLYEPTNLTKEYAQGFLSQPLIQGAKYYVSMCINMADSSNYKTCEIEVAFTDSIIYSNMPGSFNFTDTVKFFISNADTVFWLLVTRTYIAKGGEEYIYIGSNTPNANLSCIDTLHTGYYSTQAAYYFIDNVYVSLYPLSINEINIPNSNVFPVPANTILNVSNLRKQSHYTIIDCIGNIVIKGQISKDNGTIDVSEISDGIYFLLLNEELCYKIIITH